MIEDTTPVIFHLSSAGVIYQGAQPVVAALTASSKVWLYLTKSCLSFEFP